MLSHSSSPITQSQALAALQYFLERQSEISNDKDDIAGLLLDGMMRLGNGRMIDQAIEMVWKDSLKKVLQNILCNQDEQAIDLTESQALDAVVYFLEKDYEVAQAPSMGKLLLLLKRGSNGQIIDPVIAREWQMAIQKARQNDQFDFGFRVGTHK